MSKKEKHFFVEDDVMVRESKNIDEKELFDKFLMEYLENVKKELPDSYRAQQLRNGGAEALLVYEFETRFLKQPFSDAMKGYKQKIKEALGNLKKGGFLYKDTDGVTPDIVFSRGYNQAVEQVKRILKELGID